MLILNISRKFMKLIIMISTIFLRKVSSIKTEILTTDYTLVVLNLNSTRYDDLAEVVIPIIKVGVNSKGDSLFLQVHDLNK